MQTISVRIPDDDLEWLMSLDIAGARNPSERIRSLLTQTRRQREGLHDYLACVAMLRDFLQPFLNAVAAAERRHGVHSEIVSTVVEGLPDAMAEAIAFVPHAGDKAVPALVRVEAALCARTMRLLVRLLRLNVTQAVPAYDPGVLERDLREVIEIADLVKARRTSATSPQEA